jgi:hypothetical protein
MLLTQAGAAADRIGVRSASAHCKTNNIKQEQPDIREDVSDQHGKCSSVRQSESGASRTNLSRRGPSCRNTRTCCEWESIEVRWWHREARKEAQRCLHDKRAQCLLPCTHQRQLVCSECDTAVRPMA